MSAMPSRDFDQRPTPLRYLYESPARQKLVDFFLELSRTWDEDSEPLTKKEIVEITDMQRKSIIEHIDVLVELGVVKVNDEHRWERYEPAVDEDPYNALINVNNILGDFHEQHQKQ